MRKLQLLTAMAIGISASAIGAIQVEAATYNYFVDFSTKEVTNFNDYTQTFIEDTYGLENYINFNFQGSYRYDACPTTFTHNLQWILFYQVNSGPFIQQLLNLPDFVCSTTNTSYLVNITMPLGTDVIDALVNDDANYVTFYSQITFINSPATVGRILYLLGYKFYFELNYDFNTTYLFNYFLSDQQYLARATGSGGLWSFTGIQSNYLNYVFTSAGNDNYFIYNTDVTSIGTTRKKYAIDYDMEYFRGESVGSGFQTAINGIDSLLLDKTTGTESLQHRFRYYYLNAANNAQAIVDAPEFNFTYEDCGWDVFNIPCFINNGLAYITNDAPIISDAITLLNAGIAMAAQTFGIIGAFTTDNVFGYLILAGFGYVAVRWFLKND